MVNMPEAHAADHRLLFRSLMTSSLAKRPGGPRLGVGMLVYLASLGLIGAAVIICFAVASLSSLYIDDEMSLRPSAVHRGEANSTRPDLTPPSDDNVAPVKPDTTSPSADASAPMPSSPPQSSPPVEAPMPEAGPPQPAGQSSLPSEQALQPSPEAAPSAASPTPPPPGETPDQLFREFAIQRQHQKVAPDAAITPSTVMPAAPSARDSQAYEYRFRTNTPSRKSIIRKECGPIKDPAVHRDCIAYFNLHYPAR
jgi:hypothetical protein